MWVLPWESLDPSSTNIDQCGSLFEPDPSPRMMERSQLPLLYQNMSQVLCCRLLLAGESKYQIFYNFPPLNVLMLRCLLVGWVNVEDAGWPSVSGDSGSGAEFYRLTCGIYWEWCRGVSTRVQCPVCPVNTVRWFNLPPLGTFITRYQLLGGRWVAPQLADTRI